MRDVIKKKLDEMIDTEMIMQKRKNAAESMSAIEGIYGESLPLDYKAFLLERGGCYFKDEYEYKPMERTPLSTADGFESIGGFYGFTLEEFSDIESAIKFHMDRLGLVAIPVADASGGDLVCIWLKGDNKGKVYYWQHDGEPMVDDGECFYLIANSFDDFILKFAIRERESHENSNVDSRIVSIKMSDDFLKLLGRE